MPDKGQLRLTVTVAMLIAELVPELVLADVPARTERIAAILIEAFHSSRDQGIVEAFIAGRATGHNGFAAFLLSEDGFKPLMKFAAQRRAKRPRLGRSKKARAISNYRDMNAARVEKGEKKLSKAAASMKLARDLSLSIATVRRFLQGVVD